MKAWLHPTQSASGSLLWSVATAGLVLSFYVVQRQQLTWPMMIGFGIYAIAGYICLTVIRAINHRIVEIEQHDASLGDVDDR